MTPTSFEFTVTMPGDERLSGAIKQLATHAAGYAQLATEAAEGLAGHVAQATADAIACCAAERAPIEFRFSGGDEALLVVISCEAAASAPAPPSAAHGTVSVDWSRSGTRQTCHIRQRLAG